MTERRVIKLKFIGYWKNFKPQNNFIYTILSERYDVQLSDEPDYVVCSVYGQPYEYCAYPQPRIFYSGENYTPDFNLVDYGIGIYDLQFYDRYCQLNYNYNIELLEKERNYSVDILHEKKRFANFICSHESEYGIRGDFFHKLCEYKQVDSPDTYLNNMPDYRTVSRSNKHFFLKECKFTLCFESTCHQGFSTEKILDAFLADTIPVYYGDPSISSIYNEEAFINCAAYEHIEDAIAKIIELDQNDELYLKMLRQPIYVDPEAVRKKLQQVRDFLYHIIEQPLEQAYRRSRVYWPKVYNDMLLNSFSKKGSFMKHIYRKIRGIIRR